MGLTQVSTDGVKDDAIKTGKILNSTITAADLGNDCVGTAELQNSAVETVNIQDQAVALSKLPHGTSSNDGKFLRANNGADPSFESIPAGGISNVVEDTTPQLGGNLDTNGNSIAFGDSNNDAVASGNVNRLKFGAGTDMVMYHNGTDNFLKNPNGNLKIFTGADKQSIIAEPNAGVKLYYNDEKKLETTAQGADVQAEGSAVELRLKDSGGTLRGYVYGNNSNEFGFLDAGGNWPIKNTLNTKTEFNVGSTKKLTIDSDGLKFGSDTAAANALDDYEEGTFAAHGYDSSGNAFDGGLTGKYTKIGNRVHISIFFFAYGNTANKTMGSFRNLPFTGVSEPHATGVICRFSGGNHANIEHEESCYLSQGGTQIRMKNNYGTGSSKNNVLSLTYMTTA